MSEVRAQLGPLPSDSGKIVEFAKYRQLAASLPDTFASASPEQIQALLPALVERVDVRDRQVVGVVFTPPARPFFAAVTGNGGDDGAALSWRARRDSNPHTRRGDDVLAWYAGDEGDESDEGDACPRSTLRQRRSSPGR
jgi:hypothetical protein